MNKTITYRFTWQWYEQTKEGFLSTYPHIESFSGVLQMGSFIVDQQKNPPSRGMKMRYKTEMIETTILEEVKQ